MLILNLFIRVALFLIFQFLSFPINPSYAISETNFEANRYYTDGIQLSRANYWKEAVDEFRKAVQVDPKHKLAHAKLGVALSQIFRFICRNAIALSSDQCN